MDILNLWLTLLITPFFNFDLLWRMIPVYLNGLLATVYFGPSNTAAVFGGLTSLWAGADWIRVYLLDPASSPTQTNWIIAVIFCIYGALSLIIGLIKKEKYYKIFGRRSILTFFAISFYPIQAGYIAFNLDVLIAIFVMAIPIIVVVEVIAHFTRRHVLRL